MSRTWIKDENGNRASVERWGSEEAAREALATLKNCSRCSDCSGCSRCSDCFDCSDCSGCSDCSDCSGCSDCFRCSDCFGCSDCFDKRGEEGEGFKVPTIKGIHQKVYEAASQKGALDMSDWHTCETTHCRAGWIVALAGEEGKELESKTSCLFAAMQIYKASDPDHRVSPTRYFETNENAMADMKRMAELEASTGEEVHA